MAPHHRKVVDAQMAMTEPHEGIPGVGRGQHLPRDLDPLGVAIRVQTNAVALSTPGESPLPHCSMKTAAMTWAGPSACTSGPKVAASSLRQAHVSPSSSAELVSRVDQNAFQRPAMACTSSLGAWPLVTPNSLARFSAYHRPP